MSIAAGATLDLPQLRLSRNAQFTCIACRIVFQTSERQRNHCRTDWHKYNLKRKIADLDPVDAEQFAQKVLAQQARNRDELERQGLIYECPTCRKSYTSENGYHNHMQSKKHREMEVKKEIMAHHPPTRSDHVGPLFSDVSDLSEQSDMEDDVMAAARSDPHRICIFCMFPSEDFEGSLEHMSRVHGFFLPDQEYLIDQRGLILYLAEKIEHENLCLYCNGRGKEYKSPQAVRAHMVEKGHCKMAYDDSEDPEELLQYYYFEPLQEIEEPVVSSGQELVLNSGARLGHRKDMRIFKQRLRRNVNTEIVDRSKALEEAEKRAHEDGLTRKERRHLLAITDGRKAHANGSLSDKLGGIRETMIQQHFRGTLSVKQNLAMTRRIRCQTPK